MRCWWGNRSSVPMMSAPRFESCWENLRKRRTHEESLDPVAIGFLVLGGCANQEIKESAVQWDQWLGSTKDARIKEMGIPTRCHSFKDGGEVCEWTVPTQDGKPKPSA